MDTLTDTRPTFSRLTAGKARHSWRAAVPAVVVIVAVGALVAYLASNVSSSSQRASAAERDANQYRDQVAAMTKQVGDLQKDVTLARSPGRTTVIIEAPAAAAKKAAAAATPKAWAAVAWGELPNGKTWMRVNAYGLAQNLESGKAYHVWLQPASGDPIDVGAIEVDANGSGYAMKADLPAIDQGKAVILAIDASGAKQPGQTVARADLPKLQSTVTQAPPQQAQDQNPPAGQNQPQQNQAKPGTDTQQMHQGK
jgi:hypothetical protein